MDGEILSISHSRFLRSSSEILQEGDLKKQQFRVRHNWIAKFVGKAVCVQVKITKAFLCYGAKRCTTIK